MDKKDNDNRMIIQSYLITTARYSFTIDQKRILTRIVEKLQPLIEGQKLKGKIILDPKKMAVEEDLFGNFYIQMAMSELIQEDGNYTRLKKALDSLNDIKFYVQDDNDVKWKKIHLIEMPCITKRGQVRFVLHREIAEVFLNYTKGYTKYVLGVSLGFSSVYSMRIYELISGQTRPIQRKISDLKAMWGLTQKAYERNYNFIQRIIEPAKKELEEKSNWTFTYECRKKGKKFDSIIFYPKHEMRNEPEEVLHDEAVRQIGLSVFVSKEIRNYLMYTVGMSETQIKNNKETIQTFCNKMGYSAIERLREMWNFAGTRSAQNPIGYLIGSIKNEIKNN